MYFDVHVVVGVGVSVGVCVVAGVGVGDGLTISPTAVACWVCFPSPVL